MILLPSYPGPTLPPYPMQVLDFITLSLFRVGEGRRYRRKRKGAMVQQGSNTFGYRFVVYRKLLPSATLPRAVFATFPFEINNLRQGSSCCPATLEGPVMNLGKRLPGVVQDIADVIGRERAIFLIGQLPRCYVTDTHKRQGPNGGRSERVILYVPKSLKPDHVLVRILGWHDAQRLVAVFGGELLNPPTLRDAIYRPWRDDAIRNLVDQGTPAQMVAEWFELTTKRVTQLAMGVLQEIPQEARRTAANDDAPAIHRRRVNEPSRSTEPSSQGSHPMGGNRHHIVGGSR